jgi:hypothetical protein
MRNEVIEEKEKAQRCAPARKHLDKVEITGKGNPKGYEYFWIFMQRFKGRKRLFLERHGSILSSIVESMVSIGGKSPALAGKLYRCISLSWPSWVPGKASSSCFKSRGNVWLYLFSWRFVVSCWDSFLPSHGLGNCGMCEGFGKRSCVFDFCLPG